MLLFREELFSDNQDYKAAPWVPVVSVKPAEVKTLAGHSLQTHTSCQPPTLLSSGTQHQLPSLPAHTLWDQLQSWSPKGLCAGSSLARDLGAEAAGACVPHLLWRCLSRTEFSLLF